MACTAIVSCHAILSVVKDRPRFFGGFGWISCTNGHIFEKVVYNLMKFCIHVVFYTKYMHNHFGGHVTFGGGAIL